MVTPIQPPLPFDPPMNETMDDHYKNVDVLAAPVTKKAKKKSNKN